jgi:hydroxymethylpyrimidine pyrophosphatase-like HAD family hydrolase
MIAHARDHLARLKGELDVRTVYADLDGTLLGPGGSLFAHPDGPSSRPASTLTAMAEAGIDLVLLSGRTRDQLREVARVLGARAYVAELGGLTVYREAGRETVHRDQGAFAGRGTPYEAMERTGAGGLVLDAFRGRLEPHLPWSSLPRETSMLLRGNVDVAQVGALLAEAGFGWLALRDNGIIPGGSDRFPGLRSIGEQEVRAYHLVPDGVGKRAAVAADRGRRRLQEANCIAVGDSVSDAEVGPEVGAVFLVANGEAAVAGSPLPGNVYLTDASHGLGFAEALVAFTNRL